MSSNQKMSGKNAIVMFDGVCNLCNTSIHFIIDHDRKQYFRFASLQSGAAQRLLSSYDHSALEVDSVMLLEDGELYTHSTAALRIARKLSFPFNLLYMGNVLPTSWRDVIYKYIAANRYRWFGKQDACRMPSPELKALFLEP